MDNEQKGEEPERGAYDVDTDVRRESGQPSDRARQNRESVMVFRDHIGEGVVSGRKQPLGELIRGGEMNGTAGDFVPIGRGEGERHLR